MPCFEEVPFYINPEISHGIVSNSHGSVPIADYHFDGALVENFISDTYTTNQDDNFKVDITSLLKFSTGFNEESYGNSLEDQLYSNPDFTDKENRSFDFGLVTTLTPDFFEITGSESLLTRALGSQASSLWHIKSRLDRPEDSGFSSYDFDTLLGHHTIALSAIYKAALMQPQSEAWSKSTHPIITFDAEFPQKVPKYEQVSKAVVIQEKEIPRSELDQFIGIDNVTNQLKKIVKLANTPLLDLDESGLEPIKSVMLHGSQGVGKTEVIRALSHDLEAAIVEVSLGDIEGKYVGRWASKINNLFEEAYARNYRTLLFFDEADGLTRSGNEEVNSNITATLKKQLEKVKEYPNVFVAFATNHPDLIDEQVKSTKRIPLQIGIGLPSEEQKILILRSLLIDESGLDPMSMDTFERADERLGRIDFDEIKKSIDGLDLSPGDLKELLAQVKRDKFFNLSDGYDLEEVNNITTEDLKRAISNFRTS